jgi:CO/xanthine dehydrogenase Mo-binding subunit
VNSDFVVVSINKEYPSGKRTVTLGVEEIRYLDLNNDMNDRIKRLEAKQDNTDIVQKYLNFNENLDVVPVTGRVRTRTKNIAGDTMIWGSSDFGIWGTAKWRGTANISFVLGNSKAAILGTSLLGSQASAYVVTSVTNPSSIMNERFNFNTYNDTASTTATWNTAGETSTYTSGQLAQSLAVALNDGTITAATLTATEVSGSFDYVMTADGGSNWESVTSGAAHTFTNTGTDLRWRATENAASTGEINNIKIDYS